MIDSDLTKEQKQSLNQLRSFLDYLNTPTPPSNKLDIDPFLKLDMGPLLKLVNDKKLTRFDLWRLIYPEKTKDQVKELHKDLILKIHPDKITKVDPLNMTKASVCGLMNSASNLPESDNQAPAAKSTPQTSRQQEHIISEFPEKYFFTSFDGNLEDFEKIYKTWSSAKDVHDYIDKKGGLPCEFRNSENNFFEFFVDKDYTETSRAFMYATRKIMDQIISKNGNCFSISHSFNSYFVDNPNLELKEQVKSEEYWRNALEHIFFFWELNRDKLKPPTSNNEIHGCLDNYFNYFLLNNEGFFRKFNDFLPASEVVSMMQKVDPRYSLYNLCKNLFWRVGTYQTLLGGTNATHLSISLYYTYFKPHMKELDLSNKDCQEMLNSLCMHGCGNRVADPSEAPPNMHWAAYDEVEISWVARDMFRQFHDKCLNSLDPYNHRVHTKRFEQPSGAAAGELVSQDANPLVPHQDKAKIDLFSKFEPQTLQVLFIELPELLVPYAMHQKDLSTLAKTIHLRRIDHNIAYGIILELVQEVVSECDGVFGTFSSFFSGNKEDKPYISKLKELISNRKTIPNKESCVALFNQLSELSQDPKVSTFVKNKFVEHRLLESGKEKEYKVSSSSFRKGFHLEGAPEPKRLTDQQH